jgi:hypothetical protein
MGTIENISEDHIVKIQPSEDVILAINPETKEELCKLMFEIGSHRVFFNTPVLCKFDKFALKFAQLLTYLSQYAENLDTRKEGEEDSDLVKLYKDPSHNPIWRKLSAIALNARSIVRELAIDIFFNYLDGYIEGVQPKKKIYWWKQFLYKERGNDLIEELERKRFAKAQIKWFKKNFRIDSLQRIFSACLAVDDLIKKNATFVLEKEIRKPLPSKGRNIEDIFAKRQESTPQDSTVTQPSSLEQL